MHTELHLQTEAYIILIIKIKQHHTYRSKGGQYWRNISILLKTDVVPIYLFADIVIVCVSDREWSLQSAAVCAQPAADWKSSCWHPAEEGGLLTQGPAGAAMFSYAVLGAWLLKYSGWQKLAPFLEPCVPLFELVWSTVARENLSEAESWAPTQDKH